MHVAAKDKSTGKEQSIKIERTGSLSEEEIDRMVKDAEAHADEDKKNKENIAEKKQVEEGIKEAKEKLAKSSTKEEFDAAKEELAKKAQKIGEIMYQNMQKEQAAGQGQQGPQAAPDGAGFNPNNMGQQQQQQQQEQPKKDGPVDADFEVVDD